jgi:predicted transcriptional regulator
MDYTIQSPPQLASHLRALRKAQGLSQQQLGELMGLSQSRVASVGQFLGVLAALRAALVLRPLDDAGAQAAADTDAW